MQFVHGRCYLFSFKVTTVLFFLLAYQWAVSDKDRNRSERIGNQSQSDADFPHSTTSLKTSMHIACAG